jgi:hypothetical protein
MDKATRIGSRWSSLILPATAVLFLVWVGFLFGPSDAVEAAEEEGKNPPTTVKDFALTDLEKRVHTPAEWKTKKAVVLFLPVQKCCLSPAAHRLKNARRAELH